jgi:hypothetical protein
MTPGKRKKLKKTGWKVGSTDEFLGLHTGESANIVSKPALSKSLKNKRIKKGPSQSGRAD